MTSEINTVAAAVNPVSPVRPGGAVLPLSRQESTGSSANVPPALVAEQRAEVKSKESERAVDSETLAKAVSDMNSYVQSIRRELQFSIDEDLGRIVVKVMDSTTQEVVRQIPAEEVLQLARYYHEMQAKEGNSVSGLFVSDSA